MATAISMSNFSATINVKKNAAMPHYRTSPRSLVCRRLRPMALAVQHQNDRELLDIFTAIRHHTTVHQAGRLLAETPHAISALLVKWRLFRDIPEAIANTRIVSERLEFTLNNLGYEFPQYPVPDGETMDSFLAKRVDEGIRKRYASRPNGICSRGRASRRSMNSS